MEQKAGNTERLILEAAEKLFMEKGYNGTKTMDIAKNAGVNHAMIHYYFRTKENLFSRIFEQKAAQLLGFFVEAFNEDYPFFEKLKTGIETHFDFLSQTPELPLFVLNEIIKDKNRRNYIFNKIRPAGEEILKRMTKAIAEEVCKGTIRPTKAGDLLMNIASLNVFAFVALQVLFSSDEDRQQEGYIKFLEERRKNNVELIINGLKIKN
ncbi:MAG: TetR/AcrR family transcriptional regulator [Dysgonamonadaceae bacterium]|jgi:AcrR family transcriptional regulator|nr:TetR/AcrR family transcriptional regulator [Dysgonamonadaceae bacterium]